MPAPGWKKKTKSPSGVGLTLVNSRKAAHKAYKDAEDKAGRDVLESVLEVRDLDNVMEQAELAGRLFAANNPLPDLLVNSEVNLENLSPAELREQRHVEEAFYRASLTVPRRPKWSPEMTAEQLNVEEQKAFLSWRRGLARLEGNEKLVMTPFEKNLDIWRQLWRVLERSDLVVLVVDARNPLFYRCPDLEAYVQELDQNKKVMLLLNKADLLTTTSRQEWASYLKSQGISFLFWSAKVATAILEGKAGFSTEASVQLNKEVGSDNDIHVLGREELLDRLQKEAEAIAELQIEGSRAALSEHVRGDSLHRDEDIVSEGHGVTQGRASLKTSRRVVVGFVGYPNVGKSSTINALVGEKKTGVTSTPGKTKHFQTLIITEQLMLCDCPGLVFPSFSSSKSDMVASGVLPIDKLTDHRGPVQVVTDSVPRTALETVYGITLPKPKLYEVQARPPSAAELLFVFAVSRGYFANGGLPDETRAARMILKDYLSGKLPYCHSPPHGPDAFVPTINNTDVQANKVSSGEDLEGTDDFSDEEELEFTNQEDQVSTSTSRRVSLQETEGTQLGTQISPENAESADNDTHLLGVVDPTGDGLARVFADLDSSSGSYLRENSAKGQKTSSASHKMHKKIARKKDRSWRAGRNQFVVPPIVNGIKIPVSYGAADRHQVQIFE